ncbi:MAG: hypothetical protein J6386_23350 [Candidatus Synoicihabitans palmerolidicus]|nr:hypothetical protein [Candidatus Synoicihabitans palmerolidicus]
MHLNPPHSEVHVSPQERWFLAIAWVVIAAKCVFVSWAFRHWDIPLNAWWIIAPTLFFAAVVTILWLAHRN